MTLGEGIEQFYVFCAFAVFGVAISLPYLFAQGFLRSKLAVWLFDGLYGGAAAFWLWIFNLKVNNGECRLFVFVGFLSGIAITCAICKSTLDKLSLRLYNLFTSKK